LLAALGIALWTANANDTAALHGADGARLAPYLAEPEFWFESFQNWQSEFLSTAMLVLLSIWLRFHGSPESKRVTHLTRRPARSRVSAPVAAQPAFAADRAPTTGRGPLSRAHRGAGRRSADRVQALRGFSAPVFRRVYPVGLEPRCR
jgi:hypothetical protein